MVHFNKKYIFTLLALTCVQVFSSETALPSYKNDMSISVHTDEEVSSALDTIMNLWQKHQLTFSFVAYSYSERCVDSPMYSQDSLEFIDTSCPTNIPLLKKVMQPNINWFLDPRFHDHEHFYDLFLSFIESFDPLDFVKFFHFITTDAGGFYNPEEGIGVCLFLEDEENNNRLLIEQKPDTNQEGDFTIGISATYKLCTHKKVLNTTCEKIVFFYHFVQKYQDTNRQQEILNRWYRTFKICDHRNLKLLLEKDLIEKTDFLDMLEAYIKRELSILDMNQKEEIFFLHDKSIYTFLKKTNNFFYYLIHFCNNEQVTNLLKIQRNSEDFAEYMFFLENDDPDLSNAAIQLFYQLNMKIIPSENFSVDEYDDYKKNILFLISQNVESLSSFFNHLLSIDYFDDFYFTSMDDKLFKELYTFFSTPIEGESEEDRIKSFLISFHNYTPSINVNSTEKNIYFLDIFSRLNAIRQSNQWGQYQLFLNNTLSAISSQSCLLYTKALYKFQEKKFLNHVRFSTVANALLIKLARYISSLSNTLEFRGFNFRSSLNNYNPDDFTLSDKHPALPRSNKLEMVFSSSENSDSHLPYLNLMDKNIRLIRRGLNRNLEATNVNAHALENLYKQDYEMLCTLLQSKGHTFEKTETIQLWDASLWKTYPQVVQFLRRLEQWTQAKAKEKPKLTQENFKKCLQLLGLENTYEFGGYIDHSMIYGEQYEKGEELLARLYAFLEEKEKQENDEKYTWGMVLSLLEAYGHCPSRTTGNLIVHMASNIPNSVTFKHMYPDHDNVESPQSILKAIEKAPDYAKELMEKGRRMMEELYIDPQNPEELNEPSLYELYLFFYERVLFNWKKVNGAYVYNSEMYCMDESGNIVRNIYTDEGIGNDRSKWQIVYPQVVFFEIERHFYKLVEKEFKDLYPF